MRILLSGAYIDFYVNKKKYKSYKTKRGRWNYVYRELNKILKSLKGRIINNLEIRDASITSNNFWGQDRLCTINDLNYRDSNRVPLREDKITVRIFTIDLVSVILEDNFKQFFSIGDKNFYLGVGNSREI